MRPFVSETVFARAPWSVKCSVVRIWIARAACSSLMDVKGGRAEIGCTPAPEASRTMVVTRSTLSGATPSHHSAPIQSSEWLS